MFQQETNQRILHIIEGSLDNALAGFITDRRSRGLSKRTIAFYEEKLSRFRKYTQSIGVIHIREIIPNEIRLYLLQLSTTCNIGGVHAHYRALRSFFNWLDEEYEDYKNPLKNVSPPKINNQPREGVSINDVMKMVSECKTGLAERDKAILLSLLDTGCRASEFLAINLADVDLINGEINILHGKGNKQRTVYIGRNCRRRIRRYLNTRCELFDYSPLWVTNDGCRLTYSGLREIIRRRSKDSKIDEPGIHDFRRCFAIEFLRNNGDIFTLQRILGHSSLEMVKRYLSISKADCETAHRKASPVDNWKF